MSATVSKLEGRSKAWGHNVVGNWIRLTIAGRGRARDQLGIHEVVHVLTVLAVLPGDALLNGPCRREVRDTAIPKNTEQEETIGDRKINSRWKKEKRERIEMIPG